LLYASATYWPSIQSYGLALPVTALLLRLCLVAFAADGLQVGVVIRTAIGHIDYVVDLIGQADKALPLAVLALVAVAGKDAVSLPSPWPTASTITPAVM
jgi:hypothetical protein